MNLLQEWQGTRFPSGGYPYRDPRTGLSFDAMAGGMDDRIKDVQKHRRANPHVYPASDQIHLDSGFIRNQIIEFMCAARPELCGDAPLPKPVFNVFETPKQPCSKCGVTDFKPIYCASCGGQKIQGWECKNCGEKV